MADYEKIKQEVNNIMASYYTTQIQREIALLRLKTEKSVVETSNNYTLKVLKTKDDFAIVASETGLCIFDSKIYKEEIRLFTSELEEEFCRIGYTKCKGRLAEEADIEKEYCERYWILEGTDLKPIVVYDIGNTHWSFINYLDNFKELEK